MFHAQIGLRIFSLLAIFPHDESTFAFLLNNLAWATKHERYVYKEVNDYDYNGKVSYVKLDLGIDDPRWEAENRVKYEEKYGLIEVLKSGLWRTLVDFGANDDDLNQNLGWHQVDLPDKFLSDTTHSNCKQ